MHRGEATTVILSEPQALLQQILLLRQEGQTRAGKTGTLLENLQNWIHLKLEAFGGERQHLWSKITD